MSMHAAMDWCARDLGKEKGKHIHASQPEVASLTAFPAALAANAAAANARDAEIPNARPRVLLTAYIMNKLF